MSGNMLCCLNVNQRFLVLAFLKSVWQYGVVSHFKKRFLMLAFLKSVWQYVVVFQCQSTLSGASFTTVSGKMYAVSFKISNAKNVWQKKRFRTEC